VRTDKSAAKAATGAFTRPLILIADDHADTRDKGIVIDAWVRVALVGIDLVDGIAQPT